MNTCPICGKEFRIYPGAGWAYKVIQKKGAVNVCSWHCVRKWEKDNEKKTK